jgi:branched-chain amino acid transport system ATP-binding protein
LNQLKINIKESGYGNKVILSDINIDIEPGKVTAFIGPNGAGKSTLLKCIIGTIDFMEGDILFNGENVSKMPAEKRVAKGIGFVPQGNRVFSDLSVNENLEIGGYLIREKQKLKERIGIVLEFFPQLKPLIKREAGDLSGGEKQQLALARALILEPEVLLLDEPSLGLSPQLVTQAFETIRKINKETGKTILIVEQKVREVLAIADKVYALKLGRLAFEEKPSELDEGKLKEIFLV